MIASSHRATALATAALAIAVLAAGAAEAGRGVKPYYSETYETKGPARGYEGFLFPDYYCSYKRYPNGRAAPTRRAGSAAASPAGSSSRPVSDAGARAWCHPGQARRPCGAWRSVMTKPCSAWKSPSADPGPSAKSVGDTKVTRRELRPWVPDRRSLCSRRPG